MPNFDLQTGDISYDGVTANIQNQSLTIGNTTIQGADPTQALTPYWLEPIGDTGIYTTPNEAVEPDDCDRYPNSPWCGGDLANWDDISNLNPLSVEGNVPIGNQEVCATFGATLFGIGLAPYTVCYRGSNAPPIQPPDVPTPALPEGTDYTYTPLGGYGSRNPACTYKIRYRFYGATRPDYLGNNEQVLDIIQEEYAPGLPMGAIVFKLGNTPTFSWRMYLVIESPTGVILRGYYTNGYGYYVQNGEVIELPPPFIVDAVAIGTCPARQPSPIPPIPYYPEDMSCNCNEMINLLRLIAIRLGVNEYPVQVPVNVADERNDHENHQSLTTLLGWVFKQMDALNGQYPIKVKVKDIDPTQEGDQEKEIKIPNSAEALAELYGMQLRSSVNSDVLIEMLLRMSSEIMQIKNAAIVTQDYSKANADFLGYKGKTVNRKVQSAFDVNQLSDLAKFLKESEKQVVSWKCDDDDSLVEYLHKLMFSAGIIKTVFWRSKDEAENLINSFRKYIDPDSDYNQERDQKFDEWIAELNREDSQFNLNAPVLPKLDKLTNQEGNQGEGLVDS